MKIAILGSGAVGGYYGARLARTGHEVVFVARGAHLAAIREKGLEIRSAALGDFTARARAEDDTEKVGRVDLVLVSVKSEGYSGWPFTPVTLRMATFMFSTPATPPP